MSRDRSANVFEIDLAEWLRKALVQIVQVCSAKMTERESFELSSRGKNA